MITSERRNVSKVLDLLGRGGPSSDPWSLPDTALVALASPRAIDVLRDRMAGSDRSEPVQNAVGLILRGVAAAPLRCGGQLLGKDLLTMARDATWFPAVRHSALAAAIKLSADPEDVAMRLKLLRDVSTGEVGDPVGDLRAHLFHELYPGQLAPEEAWRYVPIPVNPIIAYQLSQSSPKHCGQLLDALHARATRPDPVWDISLNSLAWDLLARAIAVDEDSTGIARMYDWIKVAAFDWGARTWNSDADPERVVQQWLADHPAIQQDLLVEFLRQHEQEVDMAFEAMEYRRIVFGAGHPEGFGEWCFRQALALSADFENAARWLITCAAEQSRHSMSPEEWLPAALRRVGGNPVLVDQLKGLVANEHAKLRRYRIQSIMDDICGHMP